MNNLKQYYNRQRLPVHKQRMFSSPKLALRTVCQPEPASHGECTELVRQP